MDWGSIRGRALQRSHLVFVYLFLFILFAGSQALAANIATVSPAPQCGPAGAPVVLTGENWPTSPPGRDLMVYWETSNGVVLGKIPSLNTTTWSLAVSVPADASAGLHSLVAVRHNTGVTAAFEVPCPAASATPTATHVPTSTATSASTFTPSPVATSTALPSATATPVLFPTSSATPVFTPTTTASPAVTSTPAPTATAMPYPGANFYFPPPGQTLDYQSVQAPADAGIDPTLNSALTSQLPGNWALWRHGYLVGYGGEFNHIQEVKSLRKTWHAATVGAALHQGLIPGLTQPLSVWQTNLSGKDGLATWEHVLTQSASFDYPGCGVRNDYDPGQMWTYSDLNPLNLNDALAKVYGKTGYYDNYGDVLRNAYFDAIGMQGWALQARSDGIRFYFDIEDMGRLGLLMLASGYWDGVELIPPWFVTEMESHQTDGMLVNYAGCNDGAYPALIGLNTTGFPEAPYGFMTWNNAAGDFYPGASSGWAWALGSGGYLVMWNRDNGIVLAATDAPESPSANGLPQLIEAHLIGPNPLVGP